MVDWKKMKSDLSKGLKDGFETVKEGAGKVGKKAEEMTEEGQRKLKIHNLKKKTQDLMEELGALLYNAEKETPGLITHEPSKDIIGKIDALSKEIGDLEARKDETSKPD